MTKDGEPVTTEPVEVKFEGDAVTYDKTTQTVTAVKVGTAKATITLTGHTDVLPISVTYRVVDYFFSQTVVRGEVSGESNGRVQIYSGQSTLVAERAATSWVFRVKLLPTDYTGTQAIGVGSFLDSGDHALWFALQNEDGLADGKFSVYSKDFYAGWPGTDRMPEGYHNRAFDLNGGISCEIIRSGNNYYYSIDKFYGEYTAEEVEATYPGVFSQEQSVTVTDYSVSYDETKVQEAVAAYATKGVASVAIQETRAVRLLKGAEQKYTAKCYPADKSAGTEIEWSLDKSGMTAGQAQTTIGADGTLKLAEDAAGKVEVICTAGDARDSLTVTIISETEDKSNDRLSVTGGVLLEQSGDIVFPDYMAMTNGVGDEQRYDNLGYGAILNQKVTGNFSVEFTVSDYVAYTATPKLMISLGGDHNQFYVVYRTDGTGRIETYTRHVYDNAVYDNDWVNSDNFTNFDAKQSHTFKIEVTNGIYRVTMDGTALAFKTNSGSRESTLVRSYEHCTAELPIRIATNGVSARVSNITVQSGAPLADYFHFGNARAIAGGVEMQCYDGSSDGLAWAQARTRVVRTAANRTDNCNLTMNITFSAAMHDGKAIVLLGNTQELHFCNKIAASGGIQLQLVDGSSFGATYNVPYTAGGDGTVTLALRIERNGNKNRIIVNGAEICETDYAFGAHLQFSVFNMRSDENSVTVKFTDIVFGDYEASKVYTIENLAKAVTLSVNAQAEVTFTVNCNGNPMSDGDYTVEVTTEDGKFISYDESSKKVTALSEGEATLTITVKVDGEAVCTATVTYTITARETLTEDENWTVKGGVVLYKDDKSIEFPEGNRNTNGVGDENGEHNYTDNDYSANYRKTVKGDFSIEFTVENYKTTAQYPKLMISLGGTNNQFYVVYGRLGRINRIESFTESLSGKAWYGGGWVNSVEFDSFDVNASHTFKIEVKGGIYSVSVDGKPLTFHEGENAGAVRTPVRKLADYNAELPIRISTNGVSCTVRDIKIETTPTTVPAYFGYGEKAQTASDSVTMQFTADSLGDGWDQARNRVVRTEPIPEGDFTLTLNLVFSAAMEDCKAIVNLGGSKEFHFCNKIKTGQLYLELVNMNGEYVAWGGQTDHNIPYEAGEDGTYTVELRIERNGNENRIIANGVELCRPDYAIGSYLRFSVFNTNGNDASATVKFTDITFGDYEVYNIYTVENLNTHITLTAGKEQELNYEVHLNGNKISEGYTAEIKTEDKGFVSYADGKLKGEKEGTENVTLTVKVGEKVVCTAVIEVVVSARPTATENADWTVKVGDQGGITLYTDDNSFEFTTMKDGVVSETDYVEADYSVNYKHKVIGDFSIEFTVKNYTAKAQFPKLMVSLGGLNNQFYVVYNRDGHVNRIETLTKSVNAGKEMCWDGSWLSSDEFEGGFDTQADHTYKIAVVQGIYHIYLDNQELTRFHLDNSDDMRTLIRRYEDWSTEQPVRFATKGATCTVTDIKVTNGSIEDVTKNKFFTFTKGASNLTENGFTMAFEVHGFDANDKCQNKVFYTGTLSENFTLEYTLKFSEDMTDSKWMTVIGGYTFGIENKIKGSAAKLNFILNGAGADWGDCPITVDKTDTYTVKITRADGQMKFFVNDTEVKSAAANDATALAFWTFNGNENAGEASVTATVSNLTIS